LQLLSQYLFTFHRLPLRGIGILTLAKTPARLHVLDKQIENSGYIIVWVNDTENDQHLIRWISDQLNVSVSTLTPFFENYISSLSQYLNLEKKIEWNGWGILEKSTNGHYTFLPDLTCPIGQNIVPAEKVIRKKSEHHVLVGDQTFTADDMREKLNNPIVTVAKRWLVLSAATIVIAIFALVCLFMTDHKIIDRHQHQPYINVKSAMPAYKILSKDE